MKFLFKLLFAAIYLAAAATSNGQSFPTKPVRIVIGYTPGGGIDTVARIIAPKLGEALGQPVIVDNKPGASGIIAMDYVAKAPPDGHTIFLGTAGNISVNPAFLPNVPFNLERDFKPLMQVSSVPLLLYVNPALPINSLTEFIAYAKANPGKMHYYTAGNGGMPHLAAAYLNQLAGIDTVHVAYKGSAAGLTDLMSGQIQFGFDPVGVGMPHVKAGKLRAIATTTATRLSVLPEIPRVRETVAGFEAENWYGMLVRAGTPPDVAHRLQKEIAKVLQTPEVREKLASQGTDAVGSTSEVFSSFVKSESAKWSGVIRTANIKPD